MATDSFRLLRISRPAPISLAASLHCDYVAAAGQSGVGKTSLLNRFVDDAFQPQYKATLGERADTMDGRMDSSHLQQQSGGVGLELYEYREKYSQSA